MQKQPTDFIYAGIWPRAAAYLIDRFLIALLCLFVKLPAWVASLVSGSKLSYVIFNFTAVDIVCYIIGALYFTLLTWKSGRTLGKYLMKLTVVTDDGTQLCFFRALYRETVGRFLTGILLIGYIAAGCDFEKRGFHDRLCDTRVIYSLGRYAAYPRLPKDPQISGKSGISPEFLNSDAAGIGASGVIEDSDLSSLGFTAKPDSVPQQESPEENMKNDKPEISGAD